jgi:hypothetical protein
VTVPYFPIFHSMSASGNKGNGSHICLSLVMCGVKEHGL